MIIIFIFIIVCFLSCSIFLFMKLHKNMKNYNEQKIELIVLRDQKKLTDERLNTTKNNYEKIFQEYKLLLEQMTSLKRENEIIKQDNEVKKIILEKEMALIKNDVKDKTNIMKNEWHEIKSNLTESHKMITEGIDKIKLEYEFSQRKMTKDGIKNTILHKIFWKQAKMLMLFDTPGNVKHDVTKLIFT